MLPVKPQKPVPKGPGLSRAAYRWKRGWGARLRKAGLIYLPLILLAAIVWRGAAEGQWREIATQKVLALVDDMLSDPELALRRVEVSGPDGLSRAVAERLDGLVGSPSMKLDLSALRGDLEAMGRVERAEVALAPGGVLSVSVTERRPAVLWRDAEGTLFILDRDGVEIAEAAARADHPDLVVLLGRDAPQKVREALRIAEAAPSLTTRLRALIRIGERRWDVVLDRDQRIMLPEEGAPAALARVMALHHGEDELLERDLSVIDMRIADRPVLRLKPRAAETRQRDLEQALEEAEET